ncbi:MAG: PEGA domain-containing protein [Candidatus Eisenbacteria bacterium]|nr:PEGA domain-containing protein [Candidatus Eisenbacteria bacterium]
MRKSLWESFRSLLGLSLVSILVAVALIGCAQKKRLTVEVKEGQLGVRGAEIYEAGTRNKLAVTAPGGRANFTVEIKKGTRLRLEVREPADRTLYRYEGPIEVDDARLKAGVLLVRAFPLEADSLALAGKAQLKIVTVPPGAEVMLDDESVGRTPIVLSDLTPRRVRLELKLAGYHPVREELVLQAEEFSKIDTLTPAEVTTANLSVTSDPSGARVTLDGAPTGRVTPAEFKGLTAGSHRIRLEKDGFVAYEQAVPLRAGGSGMVSGLLDPKGTAQNTGAQGQTTKPTKKDPQKDAARTEPRSDGKSDGRSDGKSDTRSEVKKDPVPARTEDPLPSGGAARRYRVSPAPGYADIYLDGRPVNQEKKPFFFLELTPGRHVFRLVNADAGVDVVVKYDVTAGDPNKNLVLDYAKGQVRGRP